MTPHLRVIDWNYRGAGQSDRSWPGGYPLDRWVDDLAVILDHLGLDTVHLWGTATGALLTLRFAARYPARVKSVMTYPWFRATPLTRQWFRVWQDIGETLGYEALGRMTQWQGSAEQHVFAEAGNELALFEIESFKRNTSIASLAKTLETFGHCDLTTDVAKLTMPVLLLAGTSGRMGIPSSQDRAIRAFTSRCAQAEVALIENAGGTYHMLEEPEKTAPIVMDFVKHHA